MTVSVGIKGNLSVRETYMLKKITIYKSIAYVKAQFK